MHQQRDRPGVFYPDVWAADALEFRADKVVGVPLPGKDHAAGVLVDGVCGGDEAEEGEGEEGGEVGVVHYEVATVAVSFVDEDFSELRVLDYAVFHYCGAD